MKKKKRKERKYLVIATQQIFKIFMKSSNDLKISIYMKIWTHYSKIVLPCGTSMALIL